MRDGVGVAHVGQAVIVVHLPLEGDARQDRDHVAALDLADDVVGGQLADFRRRILRRDDDDLPLAGDAVGVGEAEQEVLLEADVGEGRAESAGIEHLRRRGGKGDAGLVRLVRHDRHGLQILAGRGRQHEVGAGRHVDARYLAALQRHLALLEALFLAAQFLGIVVALEAIVQVRRPVLLARQLLQGRRLDDDDAARGGVVIQPLDVEADRLLEFAELAGVLVVGQLLHGGLTAGGVALVDQQDVVGDDELAQQPAQGRVAGSAFELFEDVAHALLGVGFQRLVCLALVEVQFDLIERESGPHLAHLPVGRQGDLRHRSAEQLRRQVEPRQRPPALGRLPLELRHQSFPLVADDAARIEPGAIRLDGLLRRCAGDDVLERPHAEGRRSIAPADAPFAVGRYVQQFQVGHARPDDVLQGGRCARTRFRRPRGTGRSPPS